MTETEWLDWEVPDQMLRYLWPRLSHRKLRFFITEMFLSTYKITCHESVTQPWPKLDEVLAEMRAWADSSIAMADVPRSNPAWWFLSDLEAYTARYREFAPSGWDSEWLCAYRFLKAPVGRTRLMKRLMGRPLAEIVGNPFRPVAFDPQWRTSTAVAIAQGIYESRDFSAMPILADALQDAGCENADILTHCRDESLNHVRGCWVVDLVLGKS